MHRVASMYRIPLYPHPAMPSYHPFHLSHLPRLLQTTKWTEAITEM